MRNSSYIIILLSVVFFSINELTAQDEKFIQIGDKPQLFYGWKKVWNPEWFQGSRKTKNYFEGWYFKVVSDDGARRYAFIPGVSLGKDPHSFIQVIEGNTGKTTYHRFPLSEFKYSNRRFAAKVESNFFSADSFSVDLGVGNDRIKVNLKNNDQVKYPVKFFSPGIMGWYRFVPFIECFHGVVSVDHGVVGQFNVGSDTVKMMNGKGYVEKDWGRSMPSAWVWTQSNYFSNSPNTSFMLSVANVPWLGRSFTGFLGYLYANGHLYKFATYSGAKIKELKTEGDTVRITIKSRKFTVEFEGVKGRRGALLAPVSGVMERTIHESIDASIHVKLIDRDGLILYEGNSSVAGLELVGEISKLKIRN